MPRAFLALIFLGGLATSLGNSCTDKESACQGWKSSNYCERSPEYMKENCAKTCGHCQEPANSCTDKESACQGWKNNNYCERSPDYMKENCAKTCGHCEGTETAETECPVEPLVVTDDNKYGCNGGVKSYPSDSIECFPNAHFYRKICYTAQGLKIISSDKVSNAALERTAFIISHVMEHVDEMVPEEMNSYKFRHAVMAAYPLEKTTDIPEHSNLNLAMDERARGLGANTYIPLGSSAAENAMCQADDRYLGEDITIHEFAHSLHLLGLAPVFPEFETKLEELYTAAKKKQLWGARHYAYKSTHEYFAEGVQSYFSANMWDKSAPTDRVQLEQKDPDLYKFIDLYLGNNHWNWSCPGQDGP